MRLGDLDALKEDLKKTHGITWDSWKTVEKVIDNAPTISPYKAIHDELHKGEEE